MQQNKLQAASSRDAHKDEIQTLKPNVSDERFDDVAKQIAAIKEALETLIQSVTENARLAKYGKADRDDYGPILRDMMIHDILPYDVERDLRSVLGAWSTYKINGGAAPDARDVILAFDSSRIQRRG